MIVTFSTPCNSSEPIYRVLIILKELLISILGASTRMLLFFFQETTSIVKCKPNLFLDSPLPWQS